MAWYNSAKDLLKTIQNPPKPPVEIPNPIKNGKSSPTTKPAGSPINLPGGIKVNTTVPPPKVSPTASPIKPPTTVSSIKITPTNIASPSKINSNPTIKWDGDTGKWFSQVGKDILDTATYGPYVRGATQLGVKKSFKENVGDFTDASMSQGPAKGVSESFFGKRGPSERITGVVPTKGPWGQPRAPGQQGPGGPEGFAGGGETTVDSNGIKIPGYKDAAAKGILSGPEAADDGSIGRRYQALNANLQASEGSQSVAEQEAINRRFASIGALNSGAALRNSRVQSDMSNKRFMAGRNELAAAESGEKQQAAEIAKQRNLQREQLALGSEEQRRSNELEGTKLEIGNSQFGKTLALNERITNLNADIQWQNHLDNRDFLSQISMGIFNGSSLPTWMGGSKGQDPNKSNPYYKPVVPM
jgi:hypothetical protein